MPFSLFDDLKQSGFHSSILTTYSVDPAFYDANIQYRLRSYGCQNNILVADATMLEQALEQLPDAFTHAGRKYLIVPVTSRACFHPKLIMRYGKSRAGLTLGSANATSAGWGSNRELLATLKWSEKDDSPDNQLELGLFAKAHDWLTARLPTPWDADLAYKLDLLGKQSPWLADARRNGAPQQLADGTLIDLWLSDSGSKAGLADLLISQIDEDVQRLVVISPYWDSELRALRRLQTEFEAPPVHVFLTLSDDAAARQSTFPVGALDADLKPRFHPLADNRRHRFLHAKLIMAQTRKHDFVMFGSANCSTGALGSAGTPGSNCEAAIFRRLPRGTIDSGLGLDYSVKIRIRDIAEPPVEAKPSALASFDPGRIERKGRRLIWTCPDGVSASGAAFLIAGTQLPVAAPRELRPYVEIDADQTGATVVVRVLLANGRISRAVIVADPEMLMAAAPNPLATNLKQKLDAILTGESDLINLARDVHLLFDERGGLGPSAGGGGGSRHPTGTRATGQDYGSPEEFRAALGLKADLYSDAISHAENPALQLVLQIVLRGIVNLQDSSSIDQSELEAAEDLATGEEQDDVGVGDEQPGRNTIEKPARTAAYRAISEMGPSAPISNELLAKNRVYLDRSIAKFEDYIDGLSRSRESLSLDFVTLALVMIYLMLYGCTRLYTTDEGVTEVLIPFSDIDKANADDGFLKRAARLLVRIWGTRFQDGLMARISLDREGVVLPTPILTLVILSRWILAAILCEARAAPKAKQLAMILEKQIPSLFHATSAFVAMDSDQIDSVITQMARHIGMKKLRADAIQTTVRELSNVDAAKPS